MYVTEMLKSENFSNILSPLKIVLFLAAKSLVLLIVNLSIYEYFNFINCNISISRRDVSRQSSDILFLITSNAFFGIFQCNLTQNKENYI